MQGDTIFSVLSPLGLIGFLLKYSCGFHAFIYCWGSIKSRMSLVIRIEVVSLRGVDSPLWSRILVLRFESRLKLADWSLYVML